MPVEGVRVRANVFSEIGSSGLRRSSGVVLNETYQRNLTWDSQARIYREMADTEPVIGGALFAIDNLIRQVEWSVEANKKNENTNQAQEDADFLDSCMNDMSSSWIDTVSEILTFLQYGWAYHEIVYKRRNGADPADPVNSSGQNSKFDDGKIGWRKIALRAQETLEKWEFDDKSGIKGMWQIAPPQYESVFIPIQKALLFRTTTKNSNPQGVSILRNAYRPWFFKRRIEEIEGVGIERDLAGLPFAGVDPEILSADATADQKAMLASIRDMVVNIRRDAQEGVIFPLAYDENGNLLYDFKLLSSGGSRQLDVAGAIDRKSTEIAMTMLADFILLGHQGVGTYALSADKTELFGAAIQTYLDSVAAVINQYAVPRLFALNGMPVEMLPTIVHGKVSKRDIQSTSAFVTAMVNAGLLTPDPDLMDWVRKIGDMPSRAEGEGAPVPQPPEQPQQPSQQQQQGRQQGNGQATSNGERGAPASQPQPGHTPTGITGGGGRRVPNLP